MGGYEGFRFYDLTKTGDGGKKGEEDDGDGGWNEGFAIAPEWGTNCFPKTAVTVEDPDKGRPSVLVSFNPVTFESTCKAYFHAMQELGRYILGVIAEGLGIEPDFFEGYLDKQNSFCRLTHYYREAESIKGTESHRNNPSKVEIGAAPHTGKVTFISRIVLLT